MKRLYVGGLAHSVTDKDLRDRFGKFGKVEDVELKTRTDDQGVPYKTFGYINITISDSDLKKCLSVLNKSKWKGGTLQIETAKESFLQRLCQEREEAGQLKLNPPKPGHQQQVLDSFKQAGVNNFTMKSAVPGTEIPGHKDWVVGKFGRVLPVVQLKCRRGDKVRTLKYDPSKYCHNLRVLAPPTDSEATPTPVSELTWEVEGGDEEISRKRRGEFPPFTPPQRKKTRSSSELIGSCNGSSRPITRLRPPLDSESDEDLRRIVSEQSSYNALGPEDDGLEVVSLDFIHNKRKDEDCDSGDTDELFSSRKPLETGNKMAPDKKLVKKRKKQTMTSQYDSTDEEGEEGDSGKKKQQKVKKITKMTAVNNVETEQDKMADKETLKCEEKEAKKGDEERTEETNQGSESEESDYDYDALFSNVTRLEMSLSDLQKVAEKYAPEDWSTAPRILSDDDDDISGTSKKTPKKGITPEEILAAILEGGSSDEEEERKGRKKKNKKSVVMSLLAFRGTQELEEEEQERKDGGKMETKENESSGKEESDEVSSGHSESSSSEEEEEDEEEEDDEEEEETKSKEQQEKAPEKKNESSSSEEEDSSSETESSSEEEDEEETTATVPQPIRASAEPEEAGNVKRANQKKPAAEEEAELQRRANERRLAAVHQRQKEAEENRKLIQGALSKLDAPSGGSGGKHIVFGSDDDDEEDEVNSELQRSEELPVSNQKQQQQKPSSAPRLFDSDENDEDNEDTDRFEIRPEFEGVAGQKLMELQSRFGTDERFKMDARFLDADEDKEEEEDSEMKAAVTEDEEALEEEKQKNLMILQNLLGTNSTQTAPSKTKTKTFRDVSALHYDPSKEEHAAFETKTEERKESKASRRKKREEAQKLPEVSKEIYFSVCSDLKDVFGKETEKLENQEQPETNWDQEDEDRGDEDTGDKDTRTEEEQGGFKFSFFGDESETQPEETEYKVESMAPPKLSWQQGLNDSSEEEEEEERGEEEEQEQEEEKTAPIKTTEETPLTSDLFFFFTNDQRLTDGPQWFCRTSLEDQRESWEETRTQLRQDYRKKHKDARRKLRGSQL